MTFQETMTPRERVLKALAGEPVDRPPVSNPTNVATVELMDLVDAPFPDACRDPELNARLAATGYTELGFDSIMPYFTIIQESAALGCEMQWEQKDNWPTVRMHDPIWKGPEDVKIPSGFLEHPDNVTITRSIEMLKDEYGDEVAIIGKTMGPWTLAYHVFRGRAISPDDDRRPRHDDALPRQAQGDIGAVRAGPDRRRGRRTNIPGSRHGRPGQRRVLSALSPGDTPGDGGTAARAVDPPHLRQHAGPHGLHRPEQYGRVPLSTPRTTPSWQWMRWGTGSGSSAT